MTKPSAGSAEGTPPVDLLPLSRELIASTDDCAELLNATVELLRDGLSARRCSMFLLDASRRLLLPVASCGVDAEVLRGVRIAVGEGVAGKVAESGESVLGHGTKGGERGYRNPSYLCVPLKNPGGTVIGVVSVTDSGDRPLTDQDRRFVEVIARFLSFSMDRCTLARRLSQTAAELNRALEGMPAGMLLVTSAGKVKAANSRLKGLLGWTGQAGMNLMDGVDRRVGVTLQRLTLQAIEAGQPREQELHAVTTDKPLRVRALPVDSGDVGAPEALVVVEDMTLTRELEELRQLDEMKTNFIMMVSHELRTPLTSISGSVRLLDTLYGDNLDPTQQNLLRVVGSNVARLISVVNGILDIALLDSGRMALQREPFDIGGVLRRLVEARSPIVTAKSLKVQCLIPRNLPLFHGDRHRLQQALDALLDNAAKFTPPEGRITVEAKTEDAFLLICVTDTGPGIPVEYREKIFTKFFQLENPMTRNAGGQGIGLYLARGIVMLHQGRLYVEEVPGLRGTRFCVELPLRGPNSTD